MRIHAFPEKEELRSSRHAPARKAFSTVLPCPPVLHVSTQGDLWKTVRKLMQTLLLYCISQGFHILRLDHTLHLAI